MAYTIDIADVVANNVGKFASLNAYQLAGHIANLEFWQAQVKHALAVIDGYDRRQSVRIRSQQQHIGKHDTRIFNAEEMRNSREFPDDPSESLSSAAPDRYTIGKEELKAKRREVADAFYYFVRRCNSEGLLSKTIAKQALEYCGIGMEPGDFRD
ncbi:MAG: hypothetical protein WD468_05025 [Pirellulales bacterium]